MGRIPQRFLQDHPGSHDRASDVSCRIWNGDPDNVPRTALSEFPDPRCRISDDHERKFQCDRPEPERTETVRKSIRPGHDLTDASVAVYCRSDHRRKSPWILCRRCDPDPDSADRHRTDLQWMVLPGDVLKRSSVFCDRSGCFFPCKKPRRCTAFFQLHHHADGLSLQHLLFH